MKTTALKWLSFVLIVSGCAPKQQKEVKIEPLSRNELHALQVSLQTGRSLDEVKALSEEETCQPPAFFGLNNQGKVEVPEDYNNPEGRKIEVFYYGRIRPGMEPVVFFNGGPASDSHGSATILEDFIKNPDAQKLSFIYIDQRGTGCSSPFPTEPTPEVVERLTHYTSTEIVKDSEVIREKLFGPQSQWKIFGQSYGGLIVHRYAITAPHSVKGAFAHGFSLMKDQTEWLKLRVQSQKRVSEIYFQNYPDDRESLKKLRSLISENLCFNEGGTKVCGPKIMDALTIFLGFSNSWSTLHAYINAILGSDGTLNQASLEKFVRNYVFGVYNSNGLAASVISISEISGGESDTDSCKIAEERLKAEGENPQDWLINECRLLSGMQNDQWQDLLKGLKTHLQMEPMDLQKSLRENPKLPFYLYAGEKDVFVPIETFQEETQVLGSLIHYQQFANSGHEGFYTEKQVWKDLLSTP